MREVNADALALLVGLTAGARVPIAHLVHMHFDDPLYLTAAGGSKQWDGQEWTPAGLGEIEVIKHAAGEMPPLRLTMPGLNEQQTALALEPGTEGVQMDVYDAICDPATGAVKDAVLAWTGTLNVPELIDGWQADLTVTAEHRGALALRPKPSRYTNDEQQRLYPGDTSLDVDPQTDAAQIAWPSASFWK